MIVDDDPDVGVQLQGDIEDAGHEVTDITSSFQLAVDLFERDSPDCVLVDIHLLDGQTGLDSRPLFGGPGNTVRVYLGGLGRCGAGHTSPGGRKEALHAERTR